MYDTMQYTALYSFLIAMLQCIGTIAPLVFLYMGFSNWQQTKLNRATERAYNARAIKRELNRRYNTYQR